MKHSSRFIFILVCTIAFILIVDCEDENYFEDAASPEELVDPHSFFYDRQTKTMIVDANNYAANDIVEEKNAVANDVKIIKQADNCNTHEGIFYKRLINLLLSNIHIQDKNEISITGILEIEASHSQMEILKNFNVDKTSLREIDEILSNMIKKPGYSFMFGNTHIFDTLRDIFDMVLQTIQKHPDGAVIVFAMLMVCWTFRMIRWGQRFPLFSLIQIIFVLSFFMCWWQLIQEAEIKMAAAQMKFSKMPISCQPDKMTMWDKFVSFFYGDDCEQYYHTVMSNPKLKITPAFALSHFITNVILYPITHMGTVVSDFISNATDNLSWTYGWLIKLILYLCIGIAIIMIPFCISGASFNLGLGPLLRLGVTHQKESEKGNRLQSIENREPVQVILQVTHNTNVPQNQTEQSGAPLALNVCGKKEILAAESNDQERCDDLGCGDTLKNNELSDSDVQNIKKFENSDPVKVEKNDGRGDG